MSDPYCTFVVCQPAQAVPQPIGKLHSHNAVEKFSGLLVLHSVHVGPLKGGRGERGMLVVTFPVLQFEVKLSAKVSSPSAVTTG